MGKLFRRALAFMLGMVFGVTALVGSVVGGAYWAYKNVKPIDLANKNEKVDGLGELEQASIEELLNLVADAVNDPNEYTIKRLEAEYGLDLASLLSSAGIDSNDYSKVDIDAIRDISIFSLFGNGEDFLDSVKVRALYVFLPKLLGKPLDEVLSDEAQNLIGEYSIKQITSKHPVTNELGIVSALKNLKVGAVLPAKYNATYDRDTHQYIYQVKEKSDGILDLVGNVYIGTLFDILNGSDLTTELMEGGLKSVSKKSIKEVLITIAGSASSEMATLIEKRARGFGDVTIADLFKKENGKYVFNQDKLIENISVGYLLGYEKGEDGLWYYDEGCEKPVEGVQNALASADVKELLENKDDTLMLIKSAFGDVTIGDLTNSMGLAEQLPEGMKALDGITIGDIIGDGEDIFGNLRKELSVALADTTLAELLGLNSDSSVLQSVYQIKVGKLLDPSLTGEEVLIVLQNALNGIAIGDLLGYERDGAGNWNCENKALTPFLDVTFGEAPAGLSLLVIVSIFTEGGLTEMGQALFGDLTVGAVFQSAFKFEYDESENSYYKESDEGREYVDEDFAKALNVKLWQLVSVLDKNSDYVLYNDLKDLSIGEVLYSMGLAIDKIPSGFTYVEAGEFEYLENFTEDGYALENSDVRQLSEIIFQIDVEEFRKHRKDKDYWLEKLEPVTTKSLVGMFLTEEQEESNAMIKAMLGVTVGDMLSLLKAEGDGKENLSNMINEHFDTVILNGVETKVYVGDALEIISKDWRDKSALETIGNLEFAKSATAILGTSSKREAFGHVKLIDLTKDYLPGKIEKSDFFMASLNLSMNHVADIIKVKDASNGKRIEVLFHDVGEELYEGLTILDCADDYFNLDEKLEAYAPILNMEVNSVLHAVHTKKFDSLLDDFKAGLKQMDKKDKLVVLGAGSMVVLALYEVDNENLVKLLNSAFGDETWGDYLADRFGYDYADGVYTINGVYNPIFDKLFNEKISYTFDKTKCSIKEEYLKEITLGEIATFHKKTFSLLDQANQVYNVGKFASNDEGEIYVKGDFEALTKAGFKIKLYEIYSNRNDLKKFLSQKFGSLKLGDAGAGVGKKVLSKLKLKQTFVVENGNYVVSGAFENICNDLYNVTLSEFKKKNVSIIKSAIKDANVGDILADLMNMAGEEYLGQEYSGKATLSEDKTTWVAVGDYDEVLNVLYNLNVDQTLKGFKEEGKGYFAQNPSISQLRIGYLFAKGNNVYDESLGIWRDSQGEALTFEKADGVIKRTIYNLTVGELLEEDFAFDSLLDGVYLGEILGYECNQNVLGHVHTSQCVWYEETSAIVQGQEDVGEQEVIAKLASLNQTIAGLEFSQIISDGLKLETIFADNLLGDVIGLYAVEENGETLWYRPLTVNGVKCVDSADYGNVVLQSKPESKLSSTIAKIEASKIINVNASKTIINEIKVLKLGEVLEYVNDGGVWYKTDNGNNVKVEGLIGKLADYTVNEIEQDLGEIIKSWTIADVLTEAELNDNPILNAVKDQPLNNVNNAINQVKVGVAMGYELKSDNNWYNNGLIVTDEITLILADYQIGQLSGEIALPSGKSFSTDVIDNMLENVSLKTIYPDAGEDSADGFTAILDPSWKLKDLSENLMTKLKTDTTINQLIELGVFGDYFVPENGENNFTTPAVDAGSNLTNYGAIDKIFDKRAEAMGISNERELWLNLSMPEFMTAIMQTVTVYQQWFNDNQQLLNNLGIQLPY